jgi:anti-sigma factor RsiW
MVDTEDTAEPDRRTLADLSALADGTLDPKRVASVRERISRSPELSRRYERELRAVAALHALRADRAPARVRMSLAARGERVRASRPRLVYGGALAAAVAAVVAALVLLLPGGTPGAPSVSQAAALALQGPAMAAPLPDQTHRAKLKVDVEDVYFPDWTRLGWRPIGQRVDRVGNRRAVTVYYQRGTTRIAYTILAAPALRRPQATTSRIHGVQVQSFSSHGRLVVTWRRSGHTCVLSAAGVPKSVLAWLAAWKAGA